MGRTLSALAVWVVVAIAAEALQPPQHFVEPNTLQVSAEGKSEAPPDTAQITLTLSDKEATQDAAYRNVSAAAEKLRDILKQNNVDAKQVRVSSYVVNPEYDWQKPKNRKPIAYSVSSTATLKLTDFNLANRLLAAISDLDYASNQTLTYTLENIDQAKQKAIADGYRRAQMYAETVANASSRKLGELVYAAVDMQQEVRPVFAPRAMTAEVKGNYAQPSAPTEGMGQELTTITARVNAVFRLQ